jgi:chromosomal replication initiator protein
MWFEPTELLSVDERENGRYYVLGVPTELHKFWIVQNLLDRICAEIADLKQGSFQIEIAVTGPADAGEAEQLNLVPERAPIGREIEAEKGISGGGGTAVGPHRNILNADHTFSSFVVGKNNEFAHAASFSIAESPGQENYNPLFICGPTGMGKTHLLNAVGNHIRQKFPHQRILYLRAEQFLNECVSSIRRFEMDRFRMRYREQCDVLLMDDIQVLGRGESVQEEFFHTLNDFFEKKQQVIVASDRMPKDIKGLEDRIRTRLEWGLNADIQMPDFETRMAILKYKAERKNIMMGNDVVRHVARISKRSIRELEGNLNKIKMFSELQGLPIDIDLAKRVLSAHDDVATITIEDIQKLVADHYQVRMPDLKSKTRTKPLVVARQVAMHLTKKHLDKSLVDIGRSFGGKDHTTVMNALRRIESQQSKDSELKRDLEDLDARIHNITGV